MDNRQFVVAKVGKKSLRMATPNSLNPVRLAFTFQTRPGTAELSEFLLCLTLTL